MPMLQPYFTKNPQRITRLQENYDEGVQREKVPAAVREQLDIQYLNVTPEKLRFLHQNVMGSYSPGEKNEKVRRYNELHPPGKEHSPKFWGKIFA
ncbi:hypothetical protein, conserved [Trypanosoma brucei gambiense DAL972]|uniref:Uncharacterized protein n=2 Tax=Trypanosoma brucei TaxID=5691 RepID=C9ZV07_TRYB9|nr:hypothetical protein, conserved [Trypanosoma brucei gambiense DAL972]RHW71042.1 hypothetical protein DPX39_080025200 [Trypanosoma brucei equiperdum]CBH13245.1 hypothetical protein, conserved [Trypanosoma brucei gambiense DAL972]|eukprot:XP_011775522.1 hypothetical protein, conserved [Trypanosoma brucei gambiense DAL972]